MPQMSDEEMMEAVMGGTGEACAACLSSFARFCIFASVCSSRSRHVRPANQQRMTVVGGDGRHG